MLLAFSEGFSPGSRSFSQRNPSCWKKSLMLPELEKENVPGIPEAEVQRSLLHLPPLTPTPPPVLNPIFVSYISFVPLPFEPVLQ